MGAESQFVAAVPIDGTEDSEQAANALSARAASLAHHAGELGRIVARYERTLQRVGLRGLMRRLGMRSRLDTWERVIRTSGLFDSAWYVSEYGTDTLGLEPLRHFIVCGAYDGRWPNPLFDPTYYLLTNTDVAASGMNPLVHYVLHGAGEGRAASAQFDTRSYLALNRDVDPRRINPLAHYLKHGRAERRPLSSTPRHQPVAPDRHAFQRLAAECERGRSAVMGASGIVDVIVPVYRDIDETLTCLYSVLAAQCAARYELVVVDDRSPDPELVRRLEELSSLGLIRLVRNEQNLGFVASVNRGMALHPDRDVVLLNSDAEVFNDWLDRLIWHARQPAVATVTPFSNNATICSYPQFNRGYHAPLEVGYADVDTLAAHCNRGRQVDLPTAVGFCMYITRSAINAVGLFDELTFGKGYGEENDFCTRLIDRGWRNVLAADVFVRHTGEASFGGSSAALKQSAWRKLSERHPAYEPRVRSHIEQNPALDFRSRLDVARLKRASAGSSRVLCITHTRGGGIERHLQDEEKTLRVKDRGLLALRPAVPLSLRGSLSTLAGLETPTLADVDLAALQPDLIEKLRDLAVDGIAVHSLAGWSSDMIRVVPEIAQRLGVPYDVVLHDYAPLCPQIQMVDGSGSYCGEKGLTQCGECLSANGKLAAAVHGPVPFGRSVIDIQVWRRQYGELLAGAQSVRAPSEDTARRYRRYFPDLTIIAEPHREPGFGPEKSLAAPIASGQLLRVASIGALGIAKGSHVLLAAARDAERRRLPLEFVILGYTDIDQELGAMGNVHITGRYEDATGYDRLAQLGVHVVLLPSIWPETFSYTLSMALGGGFPTAVFDIGAPADRIRSNSRCRVLPLHWSRDPARINDELLDWSKTLMASA